MKRTLLLSLVSLMLSAGVQAASVNLVSNGSFEQGLGGLGSFSGWQTNLGDAATFVDSNGQTGTRFGQATDGLWSAFFGSTAASGGSSISQTIATAPGQLYSLSFDLANDNGGGAAMNSFSVSVNSQSPLFSATQISSHDYIHEQVQFTALTNSTLLVLSASNDIGYVEIDNVVVTPVPEPSSAFVLLSGLLVMLVATARSRFAPKVN